jgi:hypothetical protein
MRMKKLSRAAARRMDGLSELHETVFEILEAGLTERGYQMYRSDEDTNVIIIETDQGTYALWTDNFNDNPWDDGNVGCCSAA